MNRLFFKFGALVTILMIAASLVCASPAHASEITYSLSELWEGSGSGNGQFNFPVDVFIAKDGRVLIADYSNNRIQLFGQNAQYLGQWGGFNAPEKIAQDSLENFYIADTNNHRIVKLSKNGDFITAWSGDIGGDFFPRGVGVAVSPDNFVYTVHAVDYVQKFDPNGNPVTSWGTNGALFIKGGLEAVRVDSKGFVYVMANDSVMKFSSQGEQLAVWGSFSGAQDLFIDSDDNIFVTNTYKNQIEKYTKDGQLLTTFGEGILYVPHGAGVDGRGRVYVADARNNRIVVFTPSTPPPFILDTPLIKQTDPRWTNTIYDHAKSQQLSCGKTIGECGCALTSLAMLLNYHGVTKDPDGNPTTPATLNTYFNKDAQCVSSGCISQGYAFGDVIWSAADRFSAEANKKFGTQKIVSLNGPGDTIWNPEMVSQDIKDNKPVVLQVKQNEHWALATGIDQNTFVINDPLLDVNRLNTAPYNNLAYAIHRFKKTASDFSLLEFTTKSPSVIQITDPMGRKIDAIPNAHISIAETPTALNTTTIGTPIAGEYKVVITSSAQAIPLAVYASNKVGGLKLKLYETQNKDKEKVTLTYKFIYDAQSAADQLKISIPIDINPHTDLNVGFCNSLTSIVPVALLSTPTFDATQVDDKTVTFEGGKTFLKNPITKQPYHLTQDVNKDGRPDAIFHYMMKDIRLDCASNKGTLRGKMKDGMSFEGSDVIKMIGSAKLAN